MPPGDLQRFLSQPTPAETEALRVLRVADQTYPQMCQSVVRVYAATVAQERYEAFQRRHQVTLRRGRHVCLYRLLGARRCPDTGRHPCDSPMLLPGIDHTSEWVRGGRTACLVSQPYDWSWATMCATVDLGRQLGFTVSVDAYASWHFPGWTTLVLYTTK